MATEPGEARQIEPTTAAATKFNDSALTVERFIDLVCTGIASTWMTVLQRTVVGQGDADPSAYRHAVMRIRAVAASREHIGPVNAWIQRAIDRGGPAMKSAALYLSTEAGPQGVGEKSLMDTFENFLCTAVAALTIQRCITTEDLTLALDPFVPLLGNYTLTAPDSVVRSYGPVDVDSLRRLSGNPAPGDQMAGCLFYVIGLPALLMILVPILVMVVGSIVLQPAQADNGAFTMMGLKVSAGVALIVDILAFWWFKIRRRNRSRWP